MRLVLAISFICVCVTAAAFLRSAALANSRFPDRRRRSAAQVRHHRRLAPPSPLLRERPVRPSTVPSHTGTERHVRKPREAPRPGLSRPWPLSPAEQESQGPPGGPCRALRSSDGMRSCERFRRSSNRPRRRARCSSRARPESARRRFGTPGWRPRASCPIEFWWRALAEKEATFSYSVVIDLLAGRAGRAAPRAPRPQRRALEIALLRRDPDGPAPEQHTLGVALLGVLRTLASSKPVVLAVDDVQWLDRSSAAMLDFAGRRLREERVALLLARRQSARLDSDRLELAVPEERRLAIRVGPLSMGALHRLVRERSVQHSRGLRCTGCTRRQAATPSTRCELVRALESSGGWIRPGHPLPVPETLEAILHERIDALPAARTLGPRRGGRGEAADRVSARRLARAGAGVRGGLDRAHER